MKSTGISISPFLILSFTLYIFNELAVGTCPACGLFFIIRSLDPELVS